MPSMHTPEQFKTKGARTVMSVIGFVLAYLLATRAIQTGSWFQYFGTVLLVALGLRLALKAITK